MCCRYYMGDYDPEEALEAYYRDAQRRADTMGVAMVSSGDVKPTNVAPVIAPSAGNRKPGGFAMKWGYRYPNRNLIIFNTRCETALDKTLFAASTKDRRCVIPASGYYEWKKDGANKQKFDIRAYNEPLYMAGLYLRLPSEKLPCFSILTTEATGSLKAIHDRMPVMLPQSLIGDWLSIERPFEEMLKCAVSDIVYMPA